MESGMWSQLPSVTGRRPSQLADTVRFSSDGCGTGALRSLFSQYDHRLEGYLTVEQLGELFSSLRGLDEVTGTALASGHVQAAIKECCCATDGCELSELPDCIQELDRRLEIVRNARWEFDFLDTHRRGLITEEQAKFLFQATHNERFSLQQFQRFINTRPKVGSSISFEEIELELCKFPTLDMVMQEMEETEKKEKARAEKARMMASARQAEEAHREMSLRLAATTQAENERREKEARKEARRLAVKEEEERRRQQAAEEEQMADRFRSRRKTIDIQAKHREEAAKAREKSQQQVAEDKRREQKEMEAQAKVKQEAEKQAQQLAREQEALREEQLKREKEEEKRKAERAAKEKAKREERRRREEEERVAAEKAAADEKARLEAEEETRHAARRESEALVELEAAAKALAAAKDEESKTAAVERQNEAKRRAKEEKEKRVRGDLKAAVKSRQIGRLEPAIKAAKSVKPAKTEWPELTEAQQLLQQLTAAMELKGAIMARKLELLQEATRKVKQSGCAAELTKELAEANALISKLEKLARQKKEIMDMKASVISELRSYSNPPPAVHKVLTATFLLLGVKERELKSWQNIQALMGKTGKESLKRRVNECEPHNLIMDTIQRVKRATDGLDVVGVAEISATAATFALWVETMVEEAENHLKTSK